MSNLITKMQSIRVYIYNLSQSAHRLSSCFTAPLNYVYILFPSDDMSVVRSSFTSPFPCICLPKSEYLNAKTSTKRCWYWSRPHFTQIHGCCEDVVVVFNNSIEFLYIELWVWCAHADKGILMYICTYMCRQICISELIWHVRENLIVDTVMVVVNPCTTSAISARNPEDRMNQTDDFYSEKSE